MSESCSLSMMAASSPSCSKALSLHIGQTCLHHRSSCSKVTLLVLAIVGALTKFLDLSPNFALIAFGLQWGFFLLQGWPQRYWDTEQETKRERERVCA